MSVLLNEAYEKGYNLNYSERPYEVQLWLSKTHKIDVLVSMSQFSRTYGYRIYFIEEGVTKVINHFFDKELDYETALEKGLLKALKLIKV